jgi:hypothetical protein
MKRGSSSVRAAAIAALFALSFAACAGKQVRVEAPPPPPPKPPTAPLAWMPSDVNVVGRVVLAPFRATELWTMWSDTQREKTPFMSFIDAALIDEVALGGLLEGREPEGIEGDVKKPSFVAAIRGRFGEGYLAKLAAQEKLVAKPAGLLTLYARPHESWAQVSPDLLLAFSSDREARVVARASEGDGVPLREAVLFQTLGAKVAFESADLAVLAEDTSGVGREILRKQGRRVGIGPLADDVLRAGLSIDMGSEVLVSAVAETADPAHAQELERSVSDTLAALGRNLIVGMLGLRPIVSALKPTVEQNFVTVRGSIRQTDLEPALRKLGTMLQMASAGSAQPTP